jgi:hypothetical protein
LNPQLWDNQCLQGVNDQFALQKDIVSEDARRTLKECHARAADVGAASFYVRRKGNNEFPCFVSKPGRTFGQIAARGTIATVQVISDQPPIAEKPIAAGSGENEAAGIMNNASIVMGSLSDPGASELASAIDMDTTRGTAVIPELEDLRRKNCDPVYGSVIGVTGATLGNNCRGQKLCSLLNNCSEVTAEAPAGGAEAGAAAQAEMARRRAAFLGASVQAPAGGAEAGAAAQAEMARRHAAFLGP